MHEVDATRTVAVSGISELESEMVSKQAGVGGCSVRTRRCIIVAKDVRCFALHSLR